MSAEDELGRSITRAVRFLTGVYKDTAQLLHALDALMGERGWQPTEASRVSFHLSNALTPENWIQQYLFRWYHPAGAQAAIEQLVGFVINFDPEGPFEEPMVLATAAVFAPPTTYEVLYHRWKTSVPVLSAVGATGQVKVLAADVYDGYLPIAVRLAGLGVPLCSLTSSEALSSRCVTPILAALASLESPAAT